MACGQPVYHQRVLIADGNLYHVDLCLDMLVAQNGKECVVKDWDEFEAAMRAGWMAAQEQIGARAGLAELEAIIEDVGLVSFLERMDPFAELRSASPALLVETRHVEDYSIFQPQQRNLLY